MVTEVDVATALVVTVKVALVAPAGTVTLAGTVAAVVLLLERLTPAPPAGAAPLSVTVPCEEFLPTTLVGFSVSDDTVVGEGVELARMLSSAMEVHGFPLTSLSARSRTYCPVVVVNEI